jgi:hypothetical protein
MTAEQIRYWAEQGVEFGAHTRTHPDLRTADALTLKEEIQGSASDLSRLLGKRVNVFAYPYGYHTEAARKCAESSFDLAFTCTEGLNGLATNPHLLHRTMVRPNNNLVDFALYLVRGSSPLNHLRSKSRPLEMTRHSSRLETDRGSNSRQHA